MKVGAEAVNEYESRIDNKRCGRRHARSEDDANHDRIHIAIADSECAETGRLPKSQPTEPGGADQVNEKQ